MNRKRRWGVRSAVASAIVLIGLSVGVLPALAVSNTAWAWTYRTSAICSESSNVLSNNYQAGNVGGGSGSINADAFSDRSDFFTSCSATFVAPAGQIAVREDLYLWTSSGWALCNEGPWEYNPSSNSYVATGWWFDGVCGAGYYTVTSAAYTLFGGSWRGGWNLAQGYYYEQ